MKKIYLLLVIFTLISFSAYSQSATCPGAEPFCAGGSTFTFPNTVGSPSVGSPDCLGSAPNPAWFYFQISESGNLNFLLTQGDNPPNFNNLDVDFICWGPFTGAQCSGLYDFPDGNTSIPDNVVACSYSAAPTEAFTIPGAIAGQVYMIMITNFSNDPGQITLTQTNINQPGAGETDCNILCPLTVTGGGVFCPGSPATLTATIAAATSYAWTGPSGPIPGNTQSIVVTQPGTYTVVVNKPGCVANATASATYTDATPPNTGTANPINVCLPSNVFNLTSNTPVIQNGDGSLIIDYHTSQLSANDGSIGPDLIGTPGSYAAPGPFPQTIYVSIEDSAACIYTTSFVINQINCCEAVTANTGSQTLCVGNDPAALTATTTASGTDAIAFVYFNSQQTGANMYTGGTLLSTATPSGGTATFDPPVLGSATSLPNVAGTYYVYAILNPTPANASCRDFEEIVITVNSQPNAGNNGGTVICDSNTAPIDLNTLITGQQPGGTWTQITGTGGNFVAATGIFTPAAGATTSTFDYTINAIAPCTASTSTATVTIHAQPNAGLDGNTTVCDSNSTIVNLADLISGEQSGGTWAQTSGTGGTFDAANGTFTTAPGTTNSTFTYTIAGTGPCVADSSVATVNITSPPVISTPTPYAACDDDANGTVCAFFLHSKDVEIVGANPGGWAVEYYETLTNAQTGAAVNIITQNPYCNISTTGSQTLYIRVYDPAAPGCYSITTLQLIINPLPVAAASVTPYQLCDVTAPAADGQEVFNLHTKDLEIANGLSLANYTVNYYLTQAEAIAYTTSTPLPNFYPSTTQTIWYNISNNATGCSAVGSLNLVVNPLPVLTSPPPMYGCSNGVVMTASFNLNQSNTAITGGAGGLTVTYHLSQLEAQTAANPLAIPYTTGSTTVWARVENTTTGCFDTISLQLIVTQGPVANTPQPLQYCDPNNDGFGVFDLTAAIAQITGSNPPPAGVSVSFHETPTDAEIGANPKPSPYSNITAWSQIMYVRVFYTTTNCANYVELKLNVNPTPVATDPGPYHECDDNYDGIANFNLDGVTPEILAALDPATHTVSYHTSLLDAQNDSGAITNVTSYPSGNTTLWVRVEINATGCYDIVELDLIVDPLPTAQQPAYPPYSLCDVNAPLGYEQFDLQSQVSMILGGQTGASVTFYPSLSQAQAQSGAIGNTTAYTNASAFVQTLGIVITNSATGCYVVSTMDIRVEPLPTPIAPSQPYVVCDADQNGYAQFDLCSLTAAMNPGGYLISYHETQPDAESGNNDLACLYQNINAYMQVVWVRAEDALTGCVRVMPIILQVEPSPVMPSTIPNLVACDQDANNQDGQTLVNLEVQTPGLLLGQNGAASDYAVTYYTSQANATAGPGSHIVNSTSYLGSNGQVIWVRVENIASGCFSIGSFILEIGTPLALTTPTPLSVCDTTPPINDQFTVFNLTVKDNEITGGAAGYTVSYYPSLTDAQNNTNLITTPTAYTNTIAAVQTLGVAVSSAALCRSFTTLDIRVLPVPTPATSPAPLAPQCENALGSGQQTFDLTTNAVYIANGDPNVTLHYFHNAQDAALMQNEITTPGAALVGDPSLLAASPRPQGLVQHVYIVVSSNTFIGSDGQNCSSLVLQPYTINPLPIANAITEHICEDDPSGVNDGFEVFDLTGYIPQLTAGNATSPASGYTVNFFTDAALTNQITNPSAYTNTSNPQVVYAQVINTTTGCSSSTPFDIIVDPKPELTAPADFTRCDDDGANDGYYDLPLDGYIAGILGSQSGTDYTVSFYNTSLADAQAGLNAIVDLAGYQAQTQTIWIRVENNLTHCYQVGSFDVIIEQYATPVVQTPNDATTICVNFTTNEVERSLTLSVINTTNYLNTPLVPQPDYTYQWYQDGALIPGAVGPGYTIDAPLANPSLPSVFEVVMTSTSALGCSVTQSFSVTQSGPAEALAGTIGYVMGEAFSQNQTLTVMVQGWGTYQYSLNDGPRQDSPVFENVPIGSNLITVWDIEDGLVNSCDALFIQQIQAIGYPHYFTPNGDGIHDTWNIVGLEDQPNTKIYIFDRFGKLIKQISSSGEGWDGTYNGNPLPSTDYWFTVDYNDGQESMKQFKAHFSLKR